MAVLVEVFSARIQAAGSPPVPAHSVALLISTRLSLPQWAPARSKRATLALPAGRSLKSSTVRRSTTPASLNSAISKAALDRSAPSALLTTKVSRQPLSEGCAALSSKLSTGPWAGSETGLAAGAGADWAHAGAGPSDIASAEVKRRSDADKPIT